VAAIGLDLTITRCVENFVTIDMKINHPTAAMNILYTLVVMRQDGIPRPI